MYDTTERQQATARGWLGARRHPRRWGGCTTPPGSSLPSGSATAPTRATGRTSSSGRGRGRRSTVWWPRLGTRRTRGSSTGGRTCACRPPSEPGSSRAGWAPLAHPGGRPGTGARSGTSRDLAAAGGMVVRARPRSLDRLPLVEQDAANEGGPGSGRTSRVCPARPDPPSFTGLARGTEPATLPRARPVRRGSRRSSGVRRTGCESVRGVP